MQPAKQPRGPKTQLSPLSVLDILQLESSPTPVAARPDTPNPAAVFRQSQQLYGRDTPRSCDGGGPVWPALTPCPFSPVRRRARVRKARSGDVFSRSSSLNDDKVPIRSFISSSLALSTSICSNSEHRQTACSASGRLQAMFASDCIFGRTGAGGNAVKEDAQPREPRALQV